LCGSKHRQKRAIHYRTDRENPDSHVTYVSHSNMPLFVRQNVKTVLTHVGVGMGAASFWRGAWYVLDDHLFPDDKEKSAVASLVLGVAGMTASQGLMHACEDMARKKFASPLAIKTARFGALYTVAVSVVLVWRGTWVGWDCVYERLHPENHQQLMSEGGGMVVIRSTDPGHATHSGLLSHLTALSLLLGTGLFASVLAPPAAVSVLRDWAVRTATPGTKAYTAPGQVLAQRLFGGGGSAGAVSAMSTSASPVALSSAGRALTTGATKLKHHPVQPPHVMLSSRSPSNLSAPPKSPNSLIRPS
jgi:Fuseless